MVYEYHCLSKFCGQDFDVIKSAADYDKAEFCPKCQMEAQRQFAPRAVYFSGTKVTDAHYNPGLGCIVKNEHHKREIMRQKNLIEVGNEKPETLHKMYDEERRRRREQSWEMVDKGWQGAE